MIELTGSCIDGLIEFNSCFYMGLSNSSFNVEVIIGGGIQDG
jgi:hypothetical protein